MKSKSAQKVKLTSYDDLFGTSEPVSGEAVTSVPLSQLHPFAGHPFRVADDAKMQETVESVKQYGVLVPGIVRPYPDGEYEIISGHRRRRACELAGIEEMPVIIRDLDDDAATVIMVDANIQREDILPSEKAKAYKMKYEAMKHQGSKREKFTADAVGEAAGESGRTVQRYIRLAELVPELLEYVDRKKISLVIGEMLSYLRAEEQGWLVDAAANSGVFPSKAKAERGEQSREADGGRNLCGSCEKGQWESQCDDLCKEAQRLFPAGIHERADGTGDLSAFGGMEAERRKGGIWRWRRYSLNIFMGWKRSSTAFTVCQRCCLRQSASSPFPAKQRFYTVFY